MGIQSVHCGQSSSIRGGGVMEDRRHITPHQQSPLNSVSNKTQSLPGHYNRSNSPLLKFKDDFNSKKKFHPYIKTDSFTDRPISKYTSDPKTKSKNTENTSRNFAPTEESKKSRRFLGGLFKRRKKGNNSCSSSSDCDVGVLKEKSQKKSKKKPSKCDSHKNNIDEIKQVNSILPPDQEYRTNYVIQTVTGKVMKMSPTGSLGREISVHSNIQPVGIPPLSTVSHSYLGRPGVSVSHDSLAPSAVSWNSESAYGSINSSMRSSRLGHSSSTDTLNRKERKEALKSRVEKLRDKIHNIGSSSDEDVGSIISSQFGSESSLNRTDSFSSRTRSSRTERYIRRKAYELETLKVETEKDRRNREIVQARILEIQKSQRLKAAKSEQNFNDLQPHYHHHRGISYMRSLPSQTNAQSSFSLSIEPYSAINSKFTNDYFSQAQRSVSYDNNIHQPAYSCNIKPLNQMYMNSEGVVPPAPPPRDRTRVMSPVDVHRPMSYSFENLNHDPNKSPHNISGIPDSYRSPFHKSLSPSPFLRGIPVPCSSPLLPNGSLPPASPCRKSFSDKPHNLMDQSQPSRPAPPKVYIPSEIMSSTTDTIKPVKPELSIHNDKRYSKTIPITSMPPSPSSDYSSYISDNSSRMSHTQLSSLPLEIETNVKSIPYNTLPVSVPSVPVSIASEVLPEKCQSDTCQGRGEPNKIINNINLNKSDTEEVATTMNNKYIPPPPKRNSSSLSRKTGEYLSKHLDMLNALDKSDGENQLEELHKKVEAAFNKEKERLVKSKCANFEEALKELELIYQSLNLNSEDIIDGAEKRDSGDVIEPKLDGENLLKKPSPDITADDLHLRKVQPSNWKSPNVKKMLETTGSYLLVSPIHVQPSIPDIDLLPPTNEHINGKNEPDVICDDVTYRNAQRANAIKVLDPQLPFGIPIGPVTQCSNSDYLHSSPTPELPVTLMYKKEPNVVTDDLAFRNFRKDLKNASNKSLNTSELDEILSEANESPLMNRRMLRSTSVDRMSVSLPNAFPKKSVLQTPRKVKHHQKTKHGGKFFNSFKDALTDTEDGNTGTSPYHWKRTPSWVERANLGVSKWEAPGTSTETLTDISSMKAQSQPDIRQAIINESKNSDGGPQDPFAFLVNQIDYLPKMNEDLPPVLVKVQATTESSVMPVKIDAKSYTQLDVTYNSKPKPFYLTNENKEHLPEPKNHVDISKLDDLISSIPVTGMKKQQIITVDKTSKKETDIFNEGLEVAKINIEKAIRSSFSSSNNEGKTAESSQSLLPGSTSIVVPSSCQPLSAANYNPSSTYDTELEAKHTNDITLRSRSLPLAKDHLFSLMHVDSLLEKLASKPFTHDNIITNFALPTIYTPNSETHVASSFNSKSDMISSSKDNSPSLPPSINDTISKTSCHDKGDSDSCPSDYTKSDTSSDPERSCSSSSGEVHLFTQIMAPMSVPFNEDTWRYCFTLIFTYILVFLILFNGADVLIVLALILALASVFITFAN